MSSQSFVTMFACATAMIALGTAACSVTAGEEPGGTSEDAVTSGASCNLPGGTDAPGAKAPRCAVIAPAGAKLRKTASITAAEVQPEGWGGLPCGWELSLASTSIGSSVASCNLWGEVDGRAAGEDISGFVHASLLDCQMADERADEFEARVKTACKNSYGTGAAGTTTYAPAECAPEAGWTKVATHTIALTQGEGRDAAAIATAAGKSAKVAAIFSASAGGQYLGCFKTGASGTYGGAAALQSTYAIGTTSAFHAISGNKTTYASSATVEYYLVRGEATVR
jgi:hypothetical protein